MRVLFLADHRPDRAPGQRFRWEQYLPYLRSHGIECDVSFLLSARDDKIFYASGGTLGKARVALRALDQRRVESSRDFLDRYDAVFVHRGALFFGPPFIERRIKRSRAKLVFDFDDAVWIHAVSRNNRLFGWLKFTDKTQEIVRIADAVVAGNPYLADFALREGATRVEIIPTTIDTDEYTPSASPPNDGSRPVCIGWTGSFSTISHFEESLGALRRIKQRFGDRVCFKVIGDGSYRNPELGIVGLPWRKESELDDLRDIDVGIMSLRDDDWSKGKCALKGLQYMALEIPTVMSPVGVNSDVIEHGVNGMLASTEDEWVDALGQLVEDTSLRLRLGKAGRQTIIDRYSVVSQRDKYLQLMRSLAR